MTQESVVYALRASCQAVSKWEVEQAIQEQQI